MVIPICVILFGLLILKLNHHDKWNGVSLEVCWVRRTPSPGAGTPPSAPALHTPDDRGSFERTIPLSREHGGSGPSLCTHRSLFPSPGVRGPATVVPGVSPCGAARAGTLCVSVRPTQNAIRPVGAMGAQRCQVSKEQ